MSINLQGTALTMNETEFVYHRNWCRAAIYNGDVTGIAAHYAEAARRFPDEDFSRQRGSDTSVTRAVRRSIDEGDDYWVEDRAEAKKKLCPPVGRWASEVSA